MGPKSKPVSAEDIEQAAKGLRRLLGAAQQGTLGAKGSPETARLTYRLEGAISALESLLAASEGSDPGKD